MRDDFRGGLLATAIATPVVVICCGGGVILSAILGGIGGWLTGLGGIATMVAALGAGLVVRQIGRKRLVRPDGPPRDIGSRPDTRP